MRWWSIPLVLALGWFLFTLTPFWALYDFARAVQARDTRYVQQHVNFRTLRISLTRQLTAALRAGGTEAEARERQRIADAATALALPLAEALVTPAMVVDLLDDGWPQSLDLPNAPTSAGAPGAGLHIPNLRRLFDFYLASEMRGFRTVVIAMPPHRPPAEQFRIRLRLRGWSWHLIDVELNETLRERIAVSLARMSKKSDEPSTPVDTSPATRP